jgi:hypothetical protein
MISAEAAITRLRRDLTLGSLVKGLLLASIFASFFVLPWLAPKVDSTVGLLIIGAVWLALTYTSARGSRLAADSPALIASGDFEEAERHIDLALRSFSLFRTAKLQSLHHLALLRHAQRRWRESALLCQALLGQRLGSLQGLSKPSRLLLADSMMELGDLRGAHEALSGLGSQRLSLNETLNLLAVQLDYEARVGAWATMVNGVMSKVQLAELMPAVNAARAQAMLALAALKSGRPDLSEWLRRRAELLGDAPALKKDRPILAELWPGQGG